MARRTKYVVSPADSRWKVISDGTVFARKWTQQAAIAKAKQLAKADKPSEVVVQGADGKIREKWTYGKDPSEIPG